MNAKSIDAIILSCGGDIKNKLHRDLVMTSALAGMQATQREIARTLKELRARIVQSIAERRAEHTTPTQEIAITTEQSVVLSVMVSVIQSIYALSIEETFKQDEQLRRDNPTDGRSGGAGQVPEVRLPDNTPHP